MKTCIVSLFLTLATATTAGAAEIPALQQPAPSPPEPRTAVLLATLSTALPAAAGGVLLGAGLSLPGANGGADRVGLAFAGTALLAGGLVFGPSIGHYYAGEVGRGVLTTLLRLGLAGTTGGLAYLGPSMMAWGGSLSSVGMVMIGAAVGAGIATVGEVVWEIVDAGYAAERAAAPAGVSVGVAPLTASLPSGRSAHGAMVAVTF